MVVVAIVVLPLWETAMRHRSVRFRELANEYERPVPIAPPWNVGREELARIEASNADWIAWRQTIARKYRRAARYPWLSVEPDLTPSP